MPEKRASRRIAIWIAGILAAVAAVIVAIPFVVDANQFRPGLERGISEALGRETRIGSLTLSVWSGSVGADDITIADDPKFSRTPFVQAQSLKVGVELRPLIFSKTVSVTGIVLERPEIKLIRASSGEWNFSSIGKKSAADPPDGNNNSSPAEVTIRQLKITDGRVTIIRSETEAKPRVYNDVEVQARDLSFGSAFPVVLTAGLPGGGSLKLDGQLGPISQQDASLTPLTVNLAVRQLDVITSGFVEPESGLAGIVDFDGGLTSDGKTAVSKGRAKVDNLKLVQGGTAATRPLLLEYALRHDLKSQSGALTDTKAEFGKAVARLNGTYRLSARGAALKLKLRGDDAPVEDLNALLPAVGVILPRGAALQAGKLNVDMAVEGPVEKLQTTGIIRMVEARLGGFDLGTKMRAVASLAGIQPSTATEIEEFSSDLRVTPEGIQAGNLLLIVPAIGKLTGNGSVGTNSALDFRMLATLNPSKVEFGGLGRLVGSKVGDEIKVPFFIRGTTSNPAFVPDAKGTAASLLESVVPGKDGKPGEENVGKSLSDSLQRLLGGKKK